MQYGPYSFELKSVSPNPFNPMTEISFSVPNDGFVELMAFDITGKKVASIFTGYQSIGMHSYTWDASNYGSGLYMVRMQSDTYVQVQKLMFLK